MPSFYKLILRLYIKVLTIFVNILKNFFRKNLGKLILCNYADSIGRFFNKLYWYQNRLGNLGGCSTKEKLNYKFEVLKTNKLEGCRVCLFSSYSYSQEISDYIIEYLKLLCKNGFKIVFISTSSLEEKKFDPLNKLCDVIIERENVGLDFASWQCALKEFDFGKSFKELLLVNDSVLPVNDKLEEIFSKMSKKNCDVWGITESDEFGKHLQSYFLHLNQNVVISPEWENFWKTLPLCRDKRTLVYNYEIKLSKVLAKKFSFSSYINNDDLVKISRENALEKAIGFNPSICYWKELIQEHNYPFVKREILFNALKEKSCYDELKAIVPDKKFKQFEEYMQILKKYA